MRNPLSCTEYVEHFIYLGISDSIRQFYIENSGHLCPLSWEDIDTKYSLDDLFIDLNVSEQHVSTSQTVRYSTELINTCFIIYLHCRLSRNNVMKYEAVELEIMPN